MRETASPGWHMACPTRRLSRLAPPECPHRGFVAFGAIVPALMGDAKVSRLATPEGCRQGCRARATSPPGCSWCPATARPLRTRATAETAYRPCPPVRNAGVVHQDSGHANLVPDVPCHGDPGVAMAQAGRRSLQLARCVPGSLPMTVVQHHMRAPGGQRLRDAQPMPRPAPLTSATFPYSLNMTCTPWLWKVPS